MSRRWEEDRMHTGFERSHPVLARLFVNDELQALVQYHGTPQRHFYTVTRFEGGVSSEVAGQFQSLEEAKSAV